MLTNVLQGFKTHRILSCTLDLQICVRVNLVYDNMTTTTSFRCIGGVCALFLPLPFSLCVGQGNGVCARTHKQASEQGLCCVIDFLGLLPPDVQSQGHLRKLDPTGFLCLHYLDKYFSACELCGPAYLAIPPTTQRGQNSICCLQRLSVYLTL